MSTTAARSARRSARTIAAGKRRRMRLRATVYLPYTRRQRHGTRTRTAPLRRARASRRPFCGGVLRRATRLAMAGSRACCGE